MAWCYHILFIWILNCQHFLRIVEMVGDNERSLIFDTSMGTWSGNYSLFLNFTRISLIAYYLWRILDVRHEQFGIVFHLCKPDHFLQYWLEELNILRWRHNGGDGVSNHQPHHCVFNRLFRRRSMKTSKLRVTGLCVGNSPGTGEFTAQMTSNAENVYHLITSSWLSSAGLFSVEEQGVPSINSTYHHCVLLSSKY